MRAISSHGVNRGKLKTSLAGRPRGHGKKVRASKGPRSANACTAAGEAGRTDGGEEHLFPTHLNSSAAAIASLLLLSDQPSSVQFAPPRALEGAGRTNLMECGDKSSVPCRLPPSSLSSFLSLLFPFFLLNFRNGIPDHTTPTHRQMAISLTLEWRGGGGSR